jgi:DNA-binding transcriptional ArsR family regulator
VELAAKSLPANIEMERATLGACFLASIDEPEMCRAIFRYVSIDDFWLEKHVWIAAAIYDLVQQRIRPDEMSVGELLRQRGQLEGVGGHSYVGDLRNHVPSWIMAHEYARAVAECASRRRLIVESGHILAAAYDESRSLAEVHSEVLTRLELERYASRSEAGWKPHTMDSHTLYLAHFEPKPPVVEQILPSGTFLLVGKPKAKKSWYALDMALAVAYGGKALGHFQATKGEVLYIDLEMGHARMQERLKVVSPHEPTPKGLYFATEWPRIYQGCEDWLEQWMEEHPFTRLIIFDTQVGIRPPRGRNEEPYEHEKSYMQTLSNFCHKHNLAMLLVHHSRKADASDVTDDSLGSNGLVGGVDNYASLKRDNNRRDGGLVQLRGRDIRLDDDLMLTWDTMLAQWNYTPEAQKDVTTERQRILDLLDKEPGLYPKQIAEKIGIREGATRMTLMRMKQDGQVLLDEGRYFSLVEPAKKPPTA